MIIRWPFIRTAKLPAPVANQRATSDTTLISPPARLGSEALVLAADALRSHPILSLLPPRTRQRLLNGSAFLELSKGAVVFREGDPSNELFLLLSGRCEARAHDRQVLQVFAPGDTLGDRALLNREPHRTSVVVVTDCVLLRLPGAELQALFDKDAYFAGRFSQAVIGRVQGVVERGRPMRVRRVVALLPLAPGLDDHAVVQRLATELRALTGQKVLVLHLGQSADAIALDDWPKLAPTINGAFAFARSARESHHGFHELRLNAGPEPRAAASMASVLSHCSRHFDYVILHVAPDTAAVPTLEALIQCDLAYVLLQPSVQAFYDFGRLTRQLSVQTRGKSAHLESILLVDENLPSSEFRAIANQFGGHVHSFAHGFPRSGTQGDQRFDLHVRRLAREIARCRIGLALSSGGAKGLAHIGVIQVLEENGIEVDCVAGSSIGAYVGAIWAHGGDGAVLERAARENESRWGLWGLIHPAFPPHRGFLHTRPVIHRLRRSIGDAHFSDLIRPLRVVATDLDTLERVVFSSGDVARAVEASVAFPGMVVPVTIDGATLVDGGITDPLPVDVLNEMGIEHIIAVNVVPSPDCLREWHEHAHERAASAPRGRFAAFWNEGLGWFAHRNILDTLLQAMNGAQSRVAEAAARQADVVLRPLACDGAWHDLKRPRKYIELGRRVAEENLAAIKALTKGIPYENTPPPPIAYAA